MKRYALFLVSLALLAAGCTSQKKFAYLQDQQAAARDSAGTMPAFALHIGPNDILAIQVFTVNAEAFPGIASTIDKQVIDNRTAYEKGMVVDSDGFVELPLVGRVHVAGLTIPGARDTLKKLFEQYMDDPVVVVKKLSFKVTLIGEFNKPGLYYIPNEKMSLLEAIGMAGDLTIFGDRKEIRVVRQTGNGAYREILVDLTSKQPLTAETAWVYPDDVVYVRPVRNRGLATVSPNVAIWTSVIATLTLLVSVILREGNN
jgi:polysaccharide export outer membrane protein